MIQKCILLMAFLAVLFVASFVQSNLSPKACFRLMFPGSAHRRVYDFANDYLVQQQKLSDNGGGEDTWESKLEKAIDWLEGEANKSGCFAPNSYLTTANQLNALRGLKGDTYCNESTIQIVRTNHRATNFVAYKPKLKLPARPIDSIVHYYLREHAEHCSIEYAKEFNRRMSGLGQKKLRIVQSLGAGYINGKIQYLSGKSNEPKWTPTNLYCLREELSQLENFNMTQLLSIKRRPSAQVLFDALRHVARHDPNIGHLNRIISNPKVDRSERIRATDELFNRYLLIPCKYHSTKFIPNLLRPALYESMMLDPKERRPMLKWLDYHVALVATKLCWYIQVWPKMYEMQIEMLISKSAGIMDE